MDEFLVVLALATLPALGNVGGGLLAELVPFSQRTVSLSLHLAAGVVLAVVGLELMPRALEADPPWVPLLAFVAGGGLFLLLDRALGHVQARLGADDASTRPWTVYAGVALDLLSDGVLIGTGSVVSPQLGLLLAAGQVPADVPEGFAAIATLRRAGVARRTRAVLALGLSLPVLLGATLAFWVLRGAPAVVTLAVLALTGGALATVVVEEMVPEAHEGETSRLGALCFTAGFALFAALTVAVS